jgi:hypothetical protein
MARRLEDLKKYEIEFEAIIKRLKRKKPKPNQTINGQFLTTGAIIDPIEYTLDESNMADDSLYITVSYNYRYARIIYKPYRTIRPWLLWLECDEMRGGYYFKEYPSADDLYADLQSKWSRTIV